MATPLPTPPPTLDPPFRGYIETTFDSLLVFEAARRGMIPRVTRRLIERERGMVQSGAVFVFDEHESGIKRWTDGLVWSPSRILGNFLVYRETDKRANNPPTPMSTSVSNPNSTSPTSPPSNLDRSTGTMGAPMNPPDSIYDNSPSHPPLGQGQLHRARSSSEGGNVDRQRERQLVGSLTNSYKFKEGGLVKKTMSVMVNGFSQHMISYYSVEDVMSGKLRTPSTIPELASLEISPEYLHKQNFRFAPMIEVGSDGVPRYRGEPEEPNSPQSPATGPPIQYNGEVFDPYGLPPASKYDQAGAPSRQRSVTVPMPIPLPSADLGASTSYMGPGSAGSGYYDHQSMHSLHHAPPIVRQSSSSSIHSVSSSGAMRPGSSRARFDPYGSGQGSPRTSGSFAMQQTMHRRPSVSVQSQSEYYGSPTFDVKPYAYQPPPTAPSSFTDYYSGSLPPPVHSPGVSSQPAPYQTWSAQPGSAPTSRLLPSNHVPPTRTDYSSANPPSSSGSSGNANPVVAERWANQVPLAGQNWADNTSGQNHHYGQAVQGDWRTGEGTSIA